MNYLGIDVSNKTLRLVLLGADGTQCASFSLGTRRSDYEQLVARLKHWKLPPDQLVIGLEATGNHWENLYRFLTQTGWRVVLLNPYQTKKYRLALNLKAKTDDIDARVIAELLRSGHDSACYVPDDQIQSLREVVRLRYEFLQDLKDYKRQAWALLQLVFPEFTDLVSDPFSEASLALLQHYPTARDLAAAPLSDIQSIVRSAGGRGLDPPTLQQLSEQARRSTYSGKAQAARGLSLRLLLEQIQKLQQAIATLQQEMEALLQPEDGTDGPGANLLTIRGVGPHTVAAFVSQTGPDGDRFASSRQLLGFIGFFPVIEESGDQRATPRLSWRGPKYLRWALYMAAVASIRHNPELRALYHKKLSQGKEPKQAIICVAVKLAQMMLSMLKSGAPYDPARVFVRR